MTDTTVSIVIPTYGLPPTLNYCLRSVVRQTYDDIEVILVDRTGRTDTRRIAARYGANYLEVETDRHRARLYGVRHSRGDYILFVDTDQILDRELVASCVAMTNRGFDALKIREVFVGRSIVAKASAYWKNRVTRNELYDPGIPRFYRRNLILAYAEDHEMNFWEDLLTYRRIASREKLRIGWCDKPVYHLEPELLSSYPRKYYGYGQAYAKLKNTPLKEEVTREKLLLTIRILVDAIRNPDVKPTLLPPCLLLLTVKTASFLLGLVQG